MGYVRQGSGLVPRSSKRKTWERLSRNIAPAPNPLEFDLPDRLDLMVISEVIVHNRHFPFFAGIITIIQNTSNSK
ncbi:MAG: hypothetical protein PVG85_04335, partial [Deltaproteobacteria bacterium]